MSTSPWKRGHKLDFFWTKLAMLEYLWIDGQAIPKACLGNHQLIELLILLYFHSQSKCTRLFDSIINLTSVQVHSMTWMCCVFSIVTIPRSNAWQVLKEGTRLQTERRCRDSRMSYPARRKMPKTCSAGEDSIGDFYMICFEGTRARDGSSQLISDVRWSHTKLGNFGLTGRTHPALSKAD